MKRKERNEMLLMLLKKYCIGVNKDEKNGNGKTLTTIHSLGMIEGACMALNLKFVETEVAVGIFTRCDRDVVRYRKH